MTPRPRDPPLALRTRRGPPSGVGTLPAVNDRLKGVRRVRDSLAEFIAGEAASGVVLVGAVVVGLAWFNLAQDSYVDVWQRPASLDVAFVHVHKDVAGWVESGLMTLFFLVVGLELKRELTVGELRDRRVAAVPIYAALGGMVAPAVIYLAITAGTDATRGWGIPVATDIALVLGILALLGSRVPPALKLFMLTLAVVDDLLGIGAIAIFYTDDLAPIWVAGAAVAVAVGIALLRRLPSGWVFGLVGVVAWYCTYRSGVKAPIAGAAIGLALPSGPIRGRELAAELEHRLVPWSAFLVVPLFGLASAAVDVSPTGLSRAYSERTTWAIIIAAVAGKLIGIVVATRFAVRGGWRTIPEGITGTQLTGVALLGGVGFSVALFVSGAAFATTPEYAEAARAGILTAAIIAAATGSLILTLSPHGRRGTDTPVP